MTSISGKIDYSQWGNTPDIKLGNTSSSFSSAKATNLEKDSFVSSKEICTDGKDDGKLSFTEKLNNFGKGLVAPITSMFKSPKNLLIGAATIAAGAGLIALTGGAAAPVFIAAGATLGTVQIGKGIYKASTAKTDGEAKEAWQGIGTGTFSVAASVAGAKSAAKAGGIQGSENMNTFQAVKACFKNVPTAVKNSWTNATSNIGGLLTKFGIKKTANPSDKALMKEAKKINKRNQKQPALTEDNANSPQADLYKEADEIKLTKAQRKARGKANVENFNNKYQTQASLEQQLQYHKTRLAELEAKGGNKGGIKAVKDQIKMIQQQLDDITQANTPTQQAPSPQQVAAAEPVKTSNLSGKQAKILKNLSKASESEVADWLSANGSDGTSDLFKAVESMYNSKYGAMKAPVEASVPTKAQAPVSAQPQEVSRAPISQIEKFNKRLAKTKAMQANINNNAA